MHAPTRKHVSTAEPTRDALFANPRERKPGQLHPVGVIQMSPIQSPVCHLPPGKALVQ